VAVLFPTLDFFSKLQKSLSEDPARNGSDPSDAYCGLEIGDRLFVLEFDGHACSEVAQGGNKLDLDFVLTGSDEIWKHLLECIAEDSPSPSKPLAALIARGELTVEADSEEDHERATQAVGILGAFLDGSRALDVEFLQPLSE
jgi:hypothetical protein